MIQTRSFGKFEGRDVIEATLLSDAATVSILNYGCVVRDWKIHKTNEAIPVVLGFDEFEHYPLHSPSFGIIAGRVANRTAHGRFQLNGTEYQLPINNGVNHLHGGISGLGRRIWELETDTASNSIKLTYHSPDGEEGYPASVNFTVIYRLQGARLTCEMKGLPSAPTPIGNTRFDFTQPTTFNVSDPERIGVDHNLVLDPACDLNQPTATVYSPQSNLELKLWTEEPGLQLFNAPDMNIPVAGLNGANYSPFSGVCLEAHLTPRTSS
jgi:aldose 1-epimerase